VKAVTSNAATMTDELFIAISSNRS